MERLQKEIGWLLQEKYHGKLTAAAKKDIERLKAGEPIDYIIGWMEFLGCKIDLSQKPLIPRLETEYWAEKVVDELKEKKEETKVLEMFAGAGAIGVAIMRHLPNASVVFADSEENCIKQIEINCKLNTISKKRYEAIQSDVFSNITGAFDYIVANPPYIPIKNKKKVQASALEYEPHAALFGGSDGLLYIEKFLEQAVKFLQPQGKIYMEFDSPQKSKIAALAKRLGYQTCEFYKDQFGKWRYVIVAINIVQ